MRTPSPATVRAWLAVILLTLLASRVFDFLALPSPQLFGALLVSQVIRDRPVWQRAQSAAWPIHRWPGADAADMAARFTSILRGLLD